MKTLTSTTDFVLEQRKLHQGDFEDYADLICREAMFKKRKLDKYQFVPCKLVDGEWVVLEEPHREDYDMYDDTVFMIHYKEYQEALDKVLFEGFEVCNRQSELICLVFKDEHFLLKDFRNKTIEDLVPYNLPLTKTALKEIGL